MGEEILNEPEKKEKKEDKKNLHDADIPG